MSPQAAEGKQPGPQDVHVLPVGESHPEPEHVSVAASPSPASHVIEESYPEIRHAPSLLPSIVCYFLLPHFRSFFLAWSLQLPTWSIDYSGPWRAV